MGEIKLSRARQAERKRRAEVRQAQDARREAMIGAARTGLYSAEQLGKAFGYERLSVYVVLRRNGLTLHQIRSGEAGPSPDQPVQPDLAAPRENAKQQKLFTYIVRAQDFNRGIRDLDELAQLHDTSKEAMRHSLYRAEREGLIPEGSTAQLRRSRSRGRVEERAHP